MRLVGYSVKIAGLNAAMMSGDICQLGGLPPGPDSCFSCLGNV